jgi:L-2-hydroxyglutarate oxidase
VTPSRYDCIVVGGGIVGLATARALQRRSGALRLLVLEKETGWGLHQSGRNSGVIHSGIYYRPGSLKAHHAREGARRLVRFCREQGISHRICGKIIVATHPGELPGLEALRQRAAANRLEVRWLEHQALREVEPAVEGVAALQVPATGVVDFRAVTQALATALRQAGADLRLDAEVLRLREGTEEVTAETSVGAFTARFLVNCAGLHSDRLMRSAGLDAPARIVPFRGEYYQLRPQRAGLIRHLVYPVPDPRFPFLGVHFTRGIDDTVHCGPNAVLALHREGYGRTAVSWEYLAELCRFAGWWRLARRYWREGARELHRSLSKRAFARSLARMVPEVRPDDLLPAAPGVRAQAVRADGTLLDDFLLVRGRRSLHVLNAPSPAATASLSLAETIADQSELAPPTQVPAA